MDNSLLDVRYINHKYIVVEKRYLEEHPEESNGEEQNIDENIAELKEELKDMHADWSPEEEPNMDDEIRLIKKWVEERENLLNTTSGYQRKSVHR